MSTLRRDRIERQLRALPPEKHAVVSDVIASLAARQQAGRVLDMDTMPASEPVLARDWNRPDEDAVWANV